jgi:hypothetical protein
MIYSELFQIAKLECILPSESDYFTPSTNRFGKCTMVGL